MYLDYLKQVKIKDEFWNKKIDLIQKNSIPYQWEVLNDRITDVPPSHAIENFRIVAGLAEGDFYGYIFQDSDVYKWLEAVAYSLLIQENKQLEQTADEVIDLLANAQQSDGYLNTHFMIKNPEKRWTNVRDAHEMYCAGHMFEAAVAYYYATGKIKFLEVSCKFADHIDSIFGPEEGKKHGYPGHQEIELALVKLYKVTNTEKYLKLAKYFLDERGANPSYFDLESELRGDDLSKRHFGDYNDAYRQCHLPVREQEVATGHAVRALYMYSGMAAVAYEAKDETLVAICNRLWNNVTKKQMYITGAIGAQDMAEDFSFDYDLPNDEVYGETCAAIGLVFFAERMLTLEKNATYAEIMEKALYNGVLSGISLDGKSYFYANPLEVYPDAAQFRDDKKHIDTLRQGWFGCACCPTNLARLILSLPGYIYQITDDTLFVNLYIGNEANLTLNGQTVKVNHISNYVKEGTCRLEIETDNDTKFKVALRAPKWSYDAHIKVNGVRLEQLIIEEGYIIIERSWQHGDHIEIEFDMNPRLMIANRNVREDAGRVSLMRGPLVYCLEEIDNGENLPDIKLEVSKQIEAEYHEELLEGVYVLKGRGIRTQAFNNDELYDNYEIQKTEEVEVKAVPYYAWNNRGVGEMMVWVRK